MTKESLQAVYLMTEADNALAAQNWLLATTQYKNAIEFANAAPADDPLFQKDVLIAACEAGLSSSLGRSTMFTESLVSAEKSINLYESMSSAERQIDVQRYVMAAVSRVLSLESLDRRNDALRAYEYARTLITRYNQSDNNLESLLSRMAARLGA